MKDTEESPPQEHAEATTPSLKTPDVTKSECSVTESVPDKAPPGTTPESKKPRKETRKSHVPVGHYEVARMGADFTHAAFFRLYTKKTPSPKRKKKPPESWHSDAKQGIYRSSLRIKKQVPLMSADEEVLVAMLAIAGVKMRRAIYDEGSGPRECLEEEKIEGEVVAIRFHRSELARLLGWGLNNVSYEAIFHSLIRLSRATLLLPGSSHPSSRIIGLPQVEWQNVIVQDWKPRTPKPPKPSKPAESAKNPESVTASIGKWPPHLLNVEVILCQNLSQFVLDPDIKIPYGLHLMRERRVLRTLGRTLYTHIVAQVRPSQERLVHLDTILIKLRGRSPTVPERSAAISAITTGTAKNLNWEISVLGRGEQTFLKVKRPQLPRDLQRWEDKRESEKDKLGGNDATKLIGVLL